MMHSTARGAQRLLHSQERLGCGCGLLHVRRHGQHSTCMQVLLCCPESSVPTQLTASGCCMSRAGTLLRRAHPPCSLLGMCAHHCAASTQAALGFAPTGCIIS